MNIIHRSFHKIFIFIENDISSFVLIMKQVLLFALCLIIIQSKCINLSIDVCLSDPNCEIQNSICKFKEI